MTWSKQLIKNWLKFKGNKIKVLFKYLLQTNYYFSFITPTRDKGNLFGAMVFTNTTQ